MSFDVPLLIGVIHLPALPGSPGAFGEHPAAVMQGAGLRAVKEAALLEKAGFEAVIIENFGDSPFYKSQVPPETIASLSVIASAVRETTRLEVGINVLRNDARSALAIAAVSGCSFMRINILSGVTATDQGLIEGDAAFLLRERQRLFGGDDFRSLRILADVHVKHGLSLSSGEIALAVEEAARRAGADAVIITGSTTGREVNPEQLARASEAARGSGVPLLIGSGAKPRDLPELLRFADGIIVGSALRRAGVAGAPLDLARTREFVKAFRAARKTRPKPGRSRKTTRKISHKAK
jgi:uncharacterized protein